MTWEVTINRVSDAYEVRSGGRLQHIVGDRGEAIDCAENTASQVHRLGVSPVQVVVEGELGARYGDPTQEHEDREALGDMRAAIVHSKLAAAYLDRIPDGGPAQETLGEARRNAHDCASLVADVFVERSGR